MHVLYHTLCVIICMCTCVHLIYYTYYTYPPPHISHTPLPFHSYIRPRFRPVQLPRQPPVPGAQGAALPVRVAAPPQGPHDARGQEEDHQEPQGLCYISTVYILVCILCAYTCIQCT